MATTAIITVAEADVYLALHADWLALTSPIKEAHIFNASLYIHANWSCADVDWADSLTIDDDIKRACAFYAYADSVGALFAPIEETEEHRSIIMEKKKLGSMEKTKQWAFSGKMTSGDPLENMDAMMALHCEKTSGHCGATLVRN